MNFKERIFDLGYSAQNPYNRLYISDKPSILYSDGDSENVIFNTIKDLPVEHFSRQEKLEEAITDWPTKYHFAWERVNILKPVEFNTNDSALELGGGTGIISEYICPKVDNLITIEGTLNRAKSIVERTKNHKNHSVIVADFLDLDLIQLFGENSFEKIFLIGVLEYAPKFAKEFDTDPIENLLKTCNKLLKKDGQLIIAIENKIGLKYLLGFDEDHNGIPYYGIQSFYKSNDVVTFSKVKLKNKLSDTGFKGSNFYYPFPDYKLPSVIIKDCEIIKRDVVRNLISTLLYNSKSQNYSGQKAPNLQEGRILKNFMDNDSLDIISNSFLVIAEKDESLEKEDKPFAFYFSNNRRYKYANEIKFIYHENSIKVLKKWYGKKTNENILNLVENGETEIDFVHGRNLNILLDTYYLLNEKENYTNLFLKWIKFVEPKIPKSGTNQFDIMPFNTIINDNDTYKLIDTTEWETRNPLTLNQLVGKYVLGEKRHFIWLLSSNEINDFLLINKTLLHFGLTELSKLEYSDLKKINDFCILNVSRNKFVISNSKPSNVSFKTKLKKMIPNRLKSKIKQLLLGENL